MHTCESTEYTLHTHIYINKPPDGTGNHHHHHRNIYAIYLSNMQCLKWKVLSFRSVVEPTLEGEY